MLKEFLPIVVGIVLASVIGITGVQIITGQLAPVTETIEAESMTKTGNWTEVSDVNASAGKYVNSSVVGSTLTFSKKAKEITIRYFYSNVSGSKFDVIADSKVLGSVSSYKADCVNTTPECTGTARYTFDQDIYDFTLNVTAGSVKLDKADTVYDRVTGTAKVITGLLPLLVVVGILVLVVRRLF